MSRRTVRLTLTACAAVLMMLAVGLTTQPSGIAIGALPFLQPVSTPDPNPDPGSGDMGLSLNRAPVNAVGYESLGSISILTSAAQPVYASPGGEILIVGDTALILPADADGNGFDTYVITGVATVDDELWLALFLGSDNPVWIPASGASQIVLRITEDETPSQRFGGR